MTNLSKLINSELLATYTEAVQEWNDLAHGDDTARLQACEARLIVARTEILRRMGETAHLGAL